MADDLIRFARLNDSNYAEWVVRMEAVLIKRGLWDLVQHEVDEEGKDSDAIAAEWKKWRDKRTKAKLDEARAELVLRVDDGQLAHMHSRDPAEIWATLKRVHRAAGFATTLALRRQFLTAKKGDEGMQAWISKVQGLAFRMEAAGINVADQDKILALTMGLPATYSGVIINFDATPPELLTLNHVITRLLNEETRQAADTPEVKEEPLDQALAVTSGRPRRAVATSDVTCYFCDAKGHYKSECPERLAWERKKKSGKKSEAMMVAGLDSDSDDEAAF